MLSLRERMWRRHPKPLSPTVVTLKRRFNVLEYGSKTPEVPDKSDSAVCCIREPLGSLSKDISTDSSELLKQQTPHGVDDTFSLSGDQAIWKQTRRDNSLIIATPCWYRLKKSLKSTILPEAYPHSVHPAYMRFTLWEFLHRLTDSIASVLTTQAMMQALGMGAASLPIAAGLSWVLKDGIGSLASILYSALISSDYDRNPKRHRFFAAILLHLSNLLEILSLILVPLAPGVFLAIGSLSYLGKHISMAASSATGFPFILTLSNRGNGGDLNGKLISQVTIAWTLGIGMGALASYWLQASFMNLILIFAPVSLIGIFSTYMACRSVPMSTLDRHRTELILDNLFNTIDINSRQVDKDILGMLNSRDSGFPKPEDIASIEGFLCSSKTSVSDVAYVEDPLMQNIIKSRASWEILQQSQTSDDDLSTQGYLLLPFLHDSKPATNIWFSIDATDEQCLKGFYHAYWCRRFLAQRTHLACDVTAPSIASWTAHITKRTFPVLLKSLKKNDWITTNVFIGRKRAAQGIKFPK